LLLALSLMQTKPAISLNSSTNWFEQTLLDSQNVKAVILPAFIMSQKVKTAK
jgi:hypothetical protein